MAPALQMARLMSVLSRPVSRWFRPSSFLVLALATAGGIAACSESSGSSPSSSTSSALSCTYENIFTEVQECRVYAGSAADPAAARRDCSARGGTISESGCATTNVLGTCTVPVGGTPTLLTALGADATECRKVRQGCTNITGGEFAAGPGCEGALEEPTFSFAPSAPAVRVCKAPASGTPPGQSAGGQVCTWEWISGATEEGRRFADYASCENVRTQRPYDPLPPSKQLAKKDPRVDDPSYRAEMVWAKSQAESSGCSCCHAASLTPRGPAVWDTEAGGNWANSFSLYGLAFAAGVIDSHLLGAYPAAENNRFARDVGTSRDLPGIPSTDPARMKRFFLGELAYRGVPLERFGVERPTPGFADQLASFEPKPCENGAGVAPDGTIAWAGPPARFVQVLTPGSKNPVTPPNLDLPEGTLWRLDAPVGTEPFAPGTVRYGVVPSGAAQGFPATGAPSPLENGRTYYLYVQLDVDVPVERCLFVR